MWKIGIWGCKQLFHRHTWKESVQLKVRFATEPSLEYPCSEVAKNQRQISEWRAYLKRPLRNIGLTTKLYIAPWSLFSAVCHCKELSWAKPQNGWHRCSSKGTNINMRSCINFSCARNNHKYTGLPAIRLQGFPSGRASLQTLGLHTKLQESQACRSLHIITCGAFAKISGNCVAGRGCYHSLYVRIQDDTCANAFVLDLNVYKCQLQGGVKIVMLKVHERSENCGKA